MSKSTSPTAEDCPRCGEPTPTVTQFAGAPEKGFGMIPVCAACSTPRFREPEPVTAPTTTEQAEQPAKVRRLPAAQRSAHDLIDEARARLKTVDAELARFDALRAERALLERILEVAT